METFDHSNFEKFHGDWNFFVEVLHNPNIKLLYDLDGIIAYSATTVLGNFKLKTGVDVHPSKITGWEYLKEVAVANNLAQEIIDTSEEDWYKPEVLETAPRYVHAKPLIRSTVNRYGADRNFILTSREWFFKPSTKRWMTSHIPMIPSENLLIRRRKDSISGKEFKVKQVEEIARTADWIVFIDDSTDFIKAVLDSGARNCLAINVPQGLVKPEFDHERLIVIGRHFEETQAMYPLYRYVKNALV